ncbi:conserved hypothetical protein [Capnocytophaga canis]|uniref:DUF6252 family protein n=1 Tax=Capnocytophaga canis TaxID=1848903 RepID=UPI000589813D|nr:DUF6252 family protein [Capnocytophaga canis]CEN44030.1 conserved hypothetical protein [Capnocytophaga canis]
MKKITSIIKFLVVPMIMLIGCDKPETPQQAEEIDENGIVLSNDFYIKAKVDGEWVVVKGDRCTYTINKDGSIQIESYRSGNDATDKTFSFSISSTTLGNHKFGDEKNGGTGLYIVNKQQYLTIDDGNVEITKLDSSKNIIEGRFQMNVKKNGIGDMKKITEGVFRCKQK